MDNVLLVNKKLTFPQLMRIAEGMSYKHEEVFIKARGKQIHRAVDTATMLESRQRADIVDTKIGCEDHENLQISSIVIALKCFNEDDS